MTMRNGTVSALLADVDLFEAFRTATNAGPSALHLAVLGGGFVALIGIVLLSARFLNPERNQPTEPQIDYLKLAFEALELDHEALRDARRIIELSHIPSPVSMLLSPANLACAVDAALAETDDEPLRQQIDRLCRRLFDVPLPDSSNRAPDE